ncbi:MAG: FAD-binding protein, partial [Syntrophobacteraceae bacterium]|nr:FAD-binding protein [Syntrophobacteraceae bacterium]
MNTKIGSALVVGAGIGGIRSALDLAELGYRVTLID